MKKLILENKGAIIFYILIILGVFILNARFDYLNNQENDYNTIAVKN